MITMYGLQDWYISLPASEKLRLENNLSVSIDDILCKEIQLSFPEQEIKVCNDLTNTLDYIVLYITGNYYKITKNLIKDIYSTEDRGYFVPVTSNIVRTYSNTTADEIVKEFLNRKVNKRELDYIKDFYNKNSSPWKSNIIQSSTNLYFSEYFPDYVPLRLSDFYAEDIISNIKGTVYRDHVDRIVSTTLYKDILNKTKSFSLDNKLVDNELYQTYVDINDKYGLPIHITPYDKTNKYITFIPDIKSVFSLQDMSKIIVKKKSGNIVDWKYCDVHMIIQPLPQLLA